MHAVLLIDDSQVMRAVFARLCAGLGYDVTAVATATQGVTCAITGKFMAAVLDGRLPACDLTALVKAVRAAAPQSAILVIASLHERDVVRRAVAAGADGVVLRPLRRAQLHDALRPCERRSRREG